MLPEWLFYIIIAGLCWPYVAKYSYRKTLADFLFYSLAFAVASVDYVGVLNLYPEGLVFAR